MAITKRLKVTFDATCVVGSDMLAQIDKLIVETARKLKAGEKVNPVHKEMVRLALTEGQEAAATFELTDGIRKFIRSSYNELRGSEGDVVKFSPATIRVVK